MLYLLGGNIAEEDLDVFYNIIYFQGMDHVPLIVLITRRLSPSISKLAILSFKAS